MTLNVTILGAKHFNLVARGNDMTLMFDEKFEWWEMYTDNAAHRAYRGPGVRVFHSLAKVEKAYKSWRGIAELVENNDLNN
jgi:hypothetical protein